MRVLMVSWEYPPVVVGGLARHVHALARHLAHAGHDVVVLCRHEAGTDAATHPTTEHVSEGVRVVRVAEDPMHVTFERDLVSWTLAMGHAMVRAGTELLRAWRPEVVHAHDWLVTHPAVALAESARVPLVGTVHATEAGRHSGWLSHPLNRHVHSVEWWLANRSDALITCSEAMRAEVAHLFDLVGERIHVIHNGIEEQGWTVAEADVRRTRERYSPAGEPLLLFFGRLEWEKGVHDLLAALHGIRVEHPGSRLVVAGTGRQHGALIEQAGELGLEHVVEFVGHLPDHELRALLAAADAAVLPSRYEPFGIVALEAAAAELPLVASTAGGLGEVVIDGETGLAFSPGDIDALIAGVCAVLADAAAGARRAEAARSRLAADFDWHRIAAQTATVYRRTSPAGPTSLARPKIATGNAFTAEADGGAGNPPSHDADGDAGNSPSHDADGGAGNYGATLPLTPAAGENRREGKETFSDATRLGTGGHAAGATARYRA